MARRTMLRLGDEHGEARSEARDSHAYNELGDRLQLRPECDRLGRGAQGQNLVNDRAPDQPDENYSHRCRDAAAARVTALRTYRHRSTDALLSQPKSVANRQAFFSPPDGSITDRFAKHAGSI
jgi:hypothetical protein